MGEGCIAQAWGDWPVPETPDWTHLLRAASRRDPLAVARRTDELDTPCAELVRGIAMAVAGDQLAARPILDRCARQPHDGAMPALAARLVLATLDALFRPGTSDGVAWDRVIVEADRHGLTWLARVSHGLAASFQGDDDGHVVAAEVVADCDQRGDAWGATLVAAALAAASVRAGHVETSQVEQLTARWRDLDAGVLEAWTLSLLALVDVSGDAPDARGDAAAAETSVRSAAVPGVGSMDHTAPAASRPGQRAESPVVATSSAGTSGMGHRPVQWGGRADSSLAVPDRRGPRLDVRCFGEFRLLLDGDRLDLSAIRPRARSLLRLLAVHAGRVVQREELADALWVDREHTAAMHNLQVTLSNLRKALDAGTSGDVSSLIVREGSAYGLALPDGSRCDLLEFDEAIAQSRPGRVDGSDNEHIVRALRRAVDLYAGDLVPEEGPADWAVGLREQYRLRAAGASSTLAELELARGNAAAAAAAATRSVEIDPCRDTAWRTMIQAHRRSGDFAAQERAQRRYSEVLVDLGVDVGALAPVRVSVPARADVLSHAPGTPPRPLPRARPAGPGTSHLS